MMDPELLDRMKKRKAKHKREAAAARRRLLGSLQDQFSAIGRFVQEFELMVTEARSACLDLIAEQEDHRELAKIALHHTAMSARPLMEILRALYGQILSSKDCKLAEGEKDTISRVLGQIDTDYARLSNLRNTLLHGTWTIGHHEPDPDSTLSKLPVQKHKSSKRGLELAEVPQTVEALQAETEQCADIGHAIAMLHGNFLYPPAKVSDVFKLVDGRWQPDPPRAVEPPQASKGKSRQALRAGRTHQRCTN